MSYGNANSIMGGAASGAATGAAMGGPWGALAGGVLGGLGGGLFGGSQNYGYSKGDLDAIASQGMATAQGNYNTYTGLINNYLNQAQNISSTTFGNYYGPSTISKMAAMGLNPNGGATSSALAQQSMLMQGNLLNTGFGAQQSALGMLNQSQMGIRQAQLGGANQNFGIPQQPSWMSALGSVGGSALGYSMATGKPMFGNMSNPFSGWGGSSSSGWNGPMSGPIAGGPSSMSSMNGYTGYSTPISTGSNPLALWGNQ